MGGNRIAAFVLGGVLVTGCASPAPVLYPNEKRAAVGAVTAASWGLVRAGFRSLFSSRDPGPIERRFVERCLAERGYEVIGWR